MRITEIFKRLAGRGGDSRARRPDARSRLHTRDERRFEPQGPKLRMLLLDDIDPETMKLYPDYMERREARRNEKSEPRHVAVGGPLEADK